MCKGQGIMGNARVHTKIGISSAVLLATLEKKFVIHKFKNYITDVRHCTFSICSHLGLSSLDSPRSVTIHSCSNTWPVSPSLQGGFVFFLHTVVIGEPASFAPRRWL